jgi:hypothetical protein
MHSHKEYEKISWDCVLKLMNFNNQKFSRKTDYSVTGTTPSIERLVELKSDCFRLDTRELKKSGNLNILLADWQLYYGCKDLVKFYKYYQQFLRILAENQFKVYVFQGKILRQVTSETDLFSCYDTQMWFPQSAEMNTQLALLGHDASQFYIVHHFQMFQLMEIVREIDIHYLRENKILEGAELIRLKDQALEKSNYTLSLSPDLDDDNFSRIMNASKCREVKMIEILLPQYDATLIDFEEKVFQLLSRLDRFYGKNKKPPGLRIDFKLFINFAEDRLISFQFLINNCLGHYKANELRQLHLLNYPGTLNLSSHLQIEELLITSKFSNKAQFSLRTSEEFDKNGKKIINLNGLKSLRSFEYNIDKETISFSPYFTGKIVTVHSQEFDFNTLLSLKTLALPLIPEIDPDYKYSPGVNNLTRLKNLEFLHTDGRFLQGLDNFSLPELKQITVNLASLDKEEQNKFLQSLQKITSLSHITLLTIRAEIIDFSKFTQLKVFNCISALCKIILPSCLQELGLLEFISLYSPTKLPGIRVLNLTNMNLSQIDIKEITPSLNVLRIENCYGIEKILNCSLPRLTSLIIDNELDRPLNLDNYPALQHLDIRRSILQNKKNPSITSATFDIKQLNQIQNPWIYNLKSLNLRVTEFTKDCFDLRAFTRMISLQFDTMKPYFIQKIYLPPNLEYLNFKFFIFHSLPLIVKYLPTMCTNLDDFLTRKPLTLSILDKDGVTSSILLTKISLQKLLKVKENITGVEKIIKQPVDSGVERKSTFSAREMAMTVPFIPRLKGGTLTDKCFSSSGFDGDTKADPDQTYQEDKFIYQHNGPESELKPVTTHDYRFQTLTVGKTADLMARTVSPESSDLIELNKERKIPKWHSQKITSTDFKKIGESGCYYGAITPQQLFATYAEFARQTDGWMPLTMLTAQDHLSDIYLPENVKLRYNRASQQYEVFFSASQLGNFSGETITYIFNTQPASPFPVSSRRTPPLNNELVKILEQVFSINDKKGLLPAVFSEFFLQFKNTENSQEKLKILVDFLNKFTSGDLSDKPAYLSLINITTSARFWVQSLIEAKGACRHRAKLFCLVATYFLKLNVRLVVCGGHEDIEYEDNGIFKRIDLGGFPLKRLPPKESLSSEKEEKEPALSTTPEEKIPTTTLEQDDDTAILLFLSELQTDVDECKSWPQLVTILKSTQRLLLRTGDNEEARRISLGLQQQFTRLNYRFDYIENADELEYALSNLHIDERGSAHKLPGSLVKLITAPTRGMKPMPKCLLINWNNFTAEQMNRFKSMLDDPPMLSGLPVDPQLQIINLLNSEINVSELFASRCDDEIFWPTGTLELPPLPKEFQFISDSKSVSIESKVQTDKISVNLFHGGIS